MKLEKLMHSKGHFLVAYFPNIKVVVELSYVVSCFFEFKEEKNSPFVFSFFSILEDPPL